MELSALAARLFLYILCFHFLLISLGIALCMTTCCFPGMLLQPLLTTMEVDNAGRLIGYYLCLYK